jgi:hypothetical protein
VMNQQPLEKPDASQLHALIKMPLPYNIHYFRVVDLDTSLDDPKKLFASKKACLLVVLEYRVKSALEISLEGTDYQAVPETTSSGGSISLHLFSEEDTPPHFGHVIKGFEAAVNLLPGVKDQVTLKAVPPQASALCPLDVLPGTIIAEYATLRDRVSGFTRLGSTMRSGDFPCMSISPAAGGDVHTCTSLVSRC